MNKIIQANHIEYLSLLLVLSFLVIHNIYIVLVGIILSLYIINKKFIIRFIKNLIFSDRNRAVNDYNKKKDIPVQIDSIKSEPNKEAKVISLVEVIEESGFIPSLEKKDNSNAA